MSKSSLAAASLGMVVSLMAGCGSSGSTPTTPTTATVSGKVADGYLANATVFLDKNHNYQLDQGEPSTVSNEQGGFTLAVPAADVGQYPIVVLAVKDRTIDLDDPGVKLSNSYVMSLPAAAVTGNGSVFVSPLSSLMKQKMDVRGLSLAQAMSELRNQMNMPSGVNMMSDYVRLGSAGSTDANKTFYGNMHTMARNMASLMGGEASRVMGTAGGATTVDVDRYLTMMGSLNLELPQLAAVPMTTRNDGMMETIAGRIASSVSAVAPTIPGMPFRNMTSFFPPMMGTTRFFNMTGHFVMPPWMGGMMGGRNTGGGTVGGSGSGGMMGGRNTGGGIAEGSSGGGMMTGRNNGGMMGNY